MKYFSAIKESTGELITELGGPVDGETREDAASRFALDYPGATDVDFVPTTKKHEKLWTRRGPGLTPLRLTGQTLGVIRVLQVLPRFDRIQVAWAMKIPFGSVSRVFSTLENEGYIERYGKKKAYLSGELKKNPAMKKRRVNYGFSKKPTSVVYRKSKSWDELMARYRSLPSKGNK